MTIQTISQAFNPVTGVFGTGNVQFFTTSGTWVVPQGIGKVRARVWGAGAPTNTNSSNYGGGGGGGFAMKTIYDLTGITSVGVTVGSGLLYISTTTGLTAGTSSFGSYCSATGGSTTASSPTAVNGVGGTGIGGDINTTGGYAWNNGGSSGGGGGGCASVFGNGGNGLSSSSNPPASQGGAGAGNGGTTGYPNTIGGGGFLTTGGVVCYTTNYFTVNPQASAVSPGTFSLDFIGTGGGGGVYQAGVNGSGGGYNAYGGCPGGGSGYGATSNGVLSAGGLVIVEW